MGENEINATAHSGAAEDAATDATTHMAEMTVKTTENAVDAPGEPQKDSALPAATVTEAETMEKNDVEHVEKAVPPSDEANGGSVEANDTIGAEEEAVEKHADSNGRSDGGDHVPVVESNGDVVMESDSIAASANDTPEPASAGAATASDGDTATTDGGVDRTEDQPMAEEQAEVSGAVVTGDVSADGKDPAKDEDVEMTDVAQAPDAVASDDAVSAAPPVHTQVHAQEAVIESRQEKKEAQDDKQPDASHANGDEASSESVKVVSASAAEEASEQWFHDGDAVENGGEVILPSEPEDDDDVQIVAPPADAQRKRALSDDSDSDQENCAGRDNVHKHTSSPSPPPQKKKKREAAPAWEMPKEFHIFDNLPADDPECAILHGRYSIHDHRASFIGYWGFREADLLGGSDKKSKFEYRSAYMHHNDGRPFSGHYGGFFNFRQFSGAVRRIKDDQVDLQFVPKPQTKDAKTRRHRNEDSSSSSSESSSGESSSDEDSGADVYDVFGRGKNKFGRFLLRGSLDTTTEQLVIRRKYLD